MILRTLTISLLLCSTAFASIEGLDEMDARKPRRAINTYYSGESAGNGWNRQSESLMYTDTLSGHEVWHLSSTPNKSNAYYTDISPANPWSADGSRMGFFSTRLISEFVRVAGTPLDGKVASTFTVSTDGAHLRAAYDSAERSYYASSGSQYFYWSPVLPDTYYTFGGRLNGQALDASAIYKNVVSDDGITYQKIIELPGLNSDLYSAKKVISPDGQYLLPKRDGKYFPARVYPETSYGLVDADGWEEYRGQLNEWAAPSDTVDGCRHDVYFPSPSYYVVLFSNYECPGIGPQMWKFNTGGTDTDGGPDYVNAETTYSSFNDFETEPLWTWYEAPTVPWKLDNSVYRHGWGHPGFDRWGRIVVFGDGNAYWEDGGIKEWGGPVAWDYKNRQLVAEPTETRFPKPLIEYPHTLSVLTYSDLNAWSDFFATSTKSSDENDNYVFTGRYDLTHDQGNPWYRAFSHHGTQNGSTNYGWTANARVAQSPDGTKVSFASTIFSSVANTGDIAWGVAYYPHPPEITSVTNNGGTYVVRFDWRLRTGSPRGYTTRGWPDEATDDPPPPRETKLFRLWRRSATTGAWQPVATTMANIFNRYNFHNGTWTGSDYWEISDTPAGAGPWEYAVTSLEHSGIESRTLSNVFISAGTQTVAYPANPKGRSGFASSFFPELTRAYNIYAKDGATPDPTRANRVATFPASSGTAWVDWLGNTDGTTRYKVTALDTQGNESAPLTTTYAAKATAGQYDVSWTAEAAPPDECDSNHPELCKTETTCLAAGNNYCSGVCQSSPCAAVCDAAHLDLCRDSTTCAAAGGNYCGDECQLAECPVVDGTKHPIKSAASKAVNHAGKQVVR